MEGIHGVAAIPGGPKVGQDRTSTPRLEVCLSIQVLCLYKGNILLLGSGADEDISRDGIIVENFDDITDSDVFPGSDLPMGAGVARGVVKEVNVVRFCAFYDFSIIVLDAVKDFLFWRGWGILGCRNTFRRGCPLEHVDVSMTWIFSLLLCGTLDELWYEAANKGLALPTHGIVVLEVATSKNAGLGIIDCSVRLMALDVFVSIFQSGDCENDKEGEDDETGRYG